MAPAKYSNREMINFILSPNLNSFDDSRTVVPEENWLPTLKLTLTLTQTLTLNGGGAGIFFGGNRLDTLLTKTYLNKRMHSRL